MWGIEKAGYSDEFNSISRCERKSKTILSEGRLIVFCSIRSAIELEKTRKIENETVRLKTKLTSLKIVKFDLTCIARDRPFQTQFNNWLSTNEHPRRPNLSLRIRCSYFVIQKNCFFFLNIINCKDLTCLRSPIEVISQGTLKKIRKGAPTPTAGPSKFEYCL